MVVLDLPNGQLTGFLIFHLSAILATHWWSKEILHIIHYNCNGNKMV